MHCEFVMTTMLYWSRLIAFMLLVPKFLKKETSEFGVTY